MASTPSKKTARKKKTAGSASRRKAAGKKSVRKKTVEPDTTSTAAAAQPDRIDGPDDRFQRIWAVVAGIPHGCVLNYGEVARLAGLPGRARMVGRALGRAPKRMALPWHRVVNAQGAISFKAGSKPHAIQREKLEDEGVVFVDGKIDLEAFSPERALDRMLWGPPGDP